MTIILFVIMLKAFAMEGINKVCKEEEKRITRYLELCCLEQNLNKHFVETKADGMISYTLCPERKPLDCPRSCNDILSLKPKASSGYYRITTDDDDTEEEVYCEMEGTNCKEKGWTRIAYVNMSQPGMECPPGLTEKRFNNLTYSLCVNNHTDNKIMSCEGTSFNTYNIPYSKVCGRVYGYQHGKGLGFSQELGLTDAYISGVSIRRHTEHVWTFASGHSETAVFGIGNYCPCNEPSIGNPPPSFVNEHYTCESGRILGEAEEPEEILYSKDRLWDGQQCNDEELDCCDNDQLPWFIRDLKEMDKGNIDFSVCGEKPLCIESGCHYSDTPIELIELYIK